MVQTYDRILGIIFLIIGIMGFVPGATPQGELLGIFMVDPVHNVIHILSGLVLLMVSFTDYAVARSTTLAFAAIYGLVTILGFLPGDTVLGLFHVNAADNVLHLLITLTALAVALPKRYHREVH